MIDRALAAAVERAAGASIASSSSAAGGCIATSWEIELSNGVRAFLKTHAKLAPQVFQREAEGLAWLAEAGAVSVPRVLAVGDDVAFLLLEHVEPGGRARADEEAFGRSLAALHRYGAPSFGLRHSNWLATLPQDNTPHADWASFYRERRLAPLVARARAGGAPASFERAFERLYGVLAERTGPPEPPARLHGDLWGGNRMVDRAGRSWLIDPAVYGGHREIDLAMMRLFGGFSARAFAAYDEAFPLAKGHEARVPLYQLYPLLAHLVMFGSSYLGQVLEAVDAVV